MKKRKFNVYKSQAYTVLRVGFMLIGCLVFSLPVQAKAQVVPENLIITEIQTGSDELIEVYNPTDDTVDFNNYRLEYYPSSANAYGSPSRTFTASAQVYPGGYIVLASTDYLVNSAVSHFGKVLADSGGTLRLAQKDGASWEGIDAVGWGSSLLAESTAHTKPGDQKSLARKIEQGVYQDTNNNSLDFSILASPNPDFTNIAPPPSADPDSEVEQPVETPDPPSVEDPAPETPDAVPAPPSTELAPENLINPYITELLPNPASPATDDNDEFIELYNPNSVDFDLSGWKLQTGNNFTYSYTFHDQKIPANGYITLYSKDTNLTLSNTSSQARLLGENGEVIDQVDQYTEAEEGRVWQLVAGTWQWGTSPTPGSANLLSVPVVAASAVKAATTKTTKPKATAAAKPKATAKTASAKTTGAKKASSTAKPASSVAEVAPKPPNSHPLLLGLAAVFALSYGVYEYRSEILRAFRNARSNSIFGKFSR